MAGNANVEDFLRPDGSVDWDRYLTMDPQVPMLDREKVRNRLSGELKGYEAQRRERANPRVAQALAGAPVAATPADLAAGSSATPAEPDVAARALERLQGKAVMNGYGQDIGDLPKPAVVPRPALPKPLEFDPDAFPNLEASDAAVPSRVRPATGPDSSRGVVSSLDPTKQRFAVNPKQGDPETDFAMPFARGGGDIERPTLSGALRQAKDYKAQGGGSPGLSADQLLSEAGSEDPARAEADMNAALAGAKRATALYRARKSAGDAVGAMNRDAADHQAEANLEKRISAGARPGAGPKRPALETGSSSLSPEPERPQFTRDLVAEAEGSTPNPRRPLATAQAMTTGAAPDTSKDEAEMDAARKAADERAFIAQIASQFGKYADIQAGTQTGDRGEVLREQADNPVKDLQAKRQLRSQKLAEQQDQEDRAFQREGQLEQRAASAQKRQQEADYQDGASAISQRRRAQAVAFYPELVRKIDPKVWSGMSAADIDTFLKEAAPAKTSGGAGTGLSGSAMNTLRGKLPQHLVDTYNAIGRVKALAAEMGGWANTKTGIAGGMLPSVFMDDKTRALRQELGGVVARFLQAGGGKSITSNEERVLIGRIAADPTSSNLRPQDLERGLAIIERSIAGDTRQAMAGAPQGAKDALLGDMGIPKEWVGQDLQAPLGAGGQKPVQPKVAIGERRLDKNGKLRERRADGWHLVEAP